MFRAKWRSDKTKIRALFKLRLEVAQVPQSGWESLVVSLVPLDVGRPTVRSERAAVVDGTCTWEKAVFESVKLSRDPKTGRINEKVYRFLVSTNESAKGRVLGEATIDFADYAESIKPSSVSLQLKGSNSSAVLHITVQRMQDDANGRENEDKAISQLTLHNQSSNGDKVETDEAFNGNNTTGDDSPFNGQAQLKFHSTRAMVMHVEPTENITKSRSFDATSAICTEGGSERNTPIDARSRNVKFEKPPRSFLSPLRNSDSLQKTSNSSDVITANGDRWGSNTEWSLSSAPDESVDGSTHSSEDTGSRDRLQESESLEKFRNDVVNLARQVEVSELELQALRKQVIKERRQGEYLSKEVCILKEERDSLKRKCELLKASHYDIGKEKLSSSQDGEDLRSVLEETRHELNHEKNLNATLNLQLQKMQDSNSELILAVKDLEELLEQKTREVLCSNCQQGSEMPVKVEVGKDLSSKKQSDGLSCQEEAKTNKESVGTNSEHEEDEELQVLARKRDDAVMAFPLEQKIADLNAEIERFKKDRDDIEMQMEQLALDYEILKQENHDISSKYEQSQLREQLRMQYECSAHISIINDLEAQVENLEKELERQGEMFEEDLDCITKTKIEQEQRAIRAEEALQKSKWNNVATAERLQDEFRKLSLQMSATFVANEKSAMKAITEASDLRLQKMHLEDLLEKAREELVSIKNQFRLQLKELLDQVDLKTNDADELQLKLKNKSDELENQRKNQEATEKTLSQEISLLKVEMEKLSTEKSELSKKINGEFKMKSEIENLKKMVEEREMLLQDRTKERNYLTEQINIAQDELNAREEEQQKLEQLIKEKELGIRNLGSDMENLRAQYNGLRKSFLEGQIEKEKMREQIWYLKDSTSSIVENDSNKSGNIGKERTGMVEVLQLEIIESSGNDPIASTASVSYQGKTDELSQEVEALKEKNQSMEDELKEMQERYSELSLKFAEVEGERQQLVMKIRSLRNLAKS